MAVLEAISWCDSNMQRVYPLADDATCMSTSPGILLPMSFLVDMQLVVPRISVPDATSGFFISAITRNSDNFTITLSFKSGSSDTAVVCAVSEDIPVTTVNTAPISTRSFYFFPVGGFTGDLAGLNGLSGTCIIGSCLDMADIGTLTFAWSATKIIDVRVYMYTAGLNSMTFVDGDNVNTIYNDVTIEAGDGIEFTVDGNTVVVSRVPTTAEEESGMTSVDDILAKVYQELGSPIRMINGLAPDDTGNFIIDEGDCVDITNSQGKLLISNPCAKPCCDDTSLGDINTSLSLLEEAQKRLEAYYEALTININAMQARLSSLIASRK